VTSGGDGEVVHIWSAYSEDAQVWLHFQELLIEAEICRRSFECADL